ncbi:MAG: Rha family transcriptional regulator [Defluviitaleaceae bacterium]|nr:Rha family transcriptional regulator [Defluviitaleaceae bacterium]
MSNELVFIKKDDVFTDSLIIAQNSYNDHRSVKNHIQAHEAKFLTLGNLRISNTEINRAEKRGRKEEIYQLNEPQASFLITLLRNTEKVVDFKLELVTEFYRMRKLLLERQSAQWLEARNQGKLSRKNETDVILTKLIPLAESQGSKNADKLYMTYSKLVNKMLGIPVGQRDKLPYRYLSAIDLLERAIENIILSEVDKGTHYKEIYKICKVKCEILRELSFLPKLEVLQADIA